MYKDRRRVAVSLKKQQQIKIKQQVNTNRRLWKSQLIEQ